MADASAWVVLAGALGGVALTGALGLVTAAQTHRWNERTRVQTGREQEVRDLRDQRRQASHSYLVATSEFYLAVDQMHLKSRRGEQFDPHEHRRAEIKELQNAYVELTITGGAEVRKHVKRHVAQHEHAPTEERGCQRNHHNAISKRPADEFVNHRLLPNAHAHAPGRRST